MRPAERPFRGAPAILFNPEKNFGSAVVGLIRDPGQPPRGLLPMKSHNMGLSKFSCDT
jgi:hypothetical protein